MSSSSPSRTYAQSSRRSRSNSASSQTSAHAEAISTHPLEGMSFQSRVIFHIVFGAFGFFIFCFITLATISTKVNARLIRGGRQDEVPRRNSSRSDRPRPSRSGRSSHSGRRGTEEQNVGVIQSTREIMRAILTGSDRPVSDEEYHVNTDSHSRTPADPSPRAALDSSHEHSGDISSPQSGSSATICHTYSSPASRHSSIASSPCSTQAPSSGTSPAVHCSEPATTLLSPSLSDHWAKLGWDWVRAGEDDADNGREDLADSMDHEGHYGTDLVAEKAPCEELLWKVDGPALLCSSSAPSEDICKRISLPTPPSTPSSGANSILQKQSFTWSNSPVDGLLDDTSFDLDLGSKNGKIGESGEDGSVGLGISEVLDTSTMSSLSSSPSAYFSSTPTSRSAFPSPSTINSRRTSSSSPPSSRSASSGPAAATRVGGKKKKVIRKCPSHDCVCDERQRRVLCPLLEEESEAESD